MSTKSRIKNSSSHQLRRLEHIQALQRSFIQDEAEELATEDTLSRLLANCDAEAAIKDNNEGFSSLVNDATLVLENASVTVERFRFLLPHEESNLLGTSMFLSGIKSKKGEGKAILHLLANPNGEQAAWMQTCTLYRVPNVDKSVPVTARTLVPQIQDFLRVLGHEATLFRHRKMVDLDNYIKYDEAVGNRMRFIDLNQDATIEVANQIKARLAPEFEQVKIVSRQGRYTIAASNKTRG